MAETSEASRYPHLALPFAFVGAAGGWLSATFVANPLVQYFDRDPRIPATIVGALFAALAGMVLTRWGRRERSIFEVEGFAPRSYWVTDGWWLHTLVVLIAGALTGAVVTAVCNVSEGPVIGALAGAACAAAFVPVCLAVLAAARRAKRARLGSLVSASDRRAVWGILATALSLATVEALPGWPATGVAESPAPWPAIGILVVLALLLGGILAADARDRRRAERAMAPGLVPRDPESAAASDAGAPRLDLGLGDDLAARVARAAAAYRGRDRTLALVQGDAEQARAAFRRARIRGLFGLATVLLMGCAQVGAQGADAARIFDERRCDGFGYRSCHRLAEAEREENPERAMLLYDRACGSSSVDSCIALGRMLQERDQREQADRYFERACEHGDRRGCLAMAR